MKPLSLSPQGPVCVKLGLGLSGVRHLCAVPCQASGAPGNHPIPAARPKSSVPLIPAGYVAENVHDFVLFPGRKFAGIGQLCTDRPAACVASNTRTRRFDVGRSAVQNLRAPLDLVEAGVL